MWRFVVCFIALLTVVSVAHAQGSITLVAVPGDNAGEIKANGSFSLDTGWSLASGGIVVIAWPTGGGIPVTVPVPNGNIDMTNLTWKVTVTGLTSGGNYNIFVQMNVKKDMTSVWIASAAGTAKAK